MCDFEEFEFLCGHKAKKLLSYCHSARVDPSHQCFSVKVVKHSWAQNLSCDPCVEAMRAAAIQFAQGSGGQGSQR
jgi:hypothetical protein